MRTLRCFASGFVLGFAAAVGAVPGVFVFFARDAVLCLLLWLGTAGAVTLMSPNLPPWLALAAGAFLGAAVWGCSWGMYYAVRALRG